MEEGLSVLSLWVDRGRGDQQRLKGEKGGKGSSVEAAGAVPSLFPSPHHSLSPDMGRLTAIDLPLTPHVSVITAPPLPASIDSASSHPLTSTQSCPSDC